MKRLIMALLAAALLIAGCGSKVPDIRDVYEALDSGSSDGTNFDIVGINSLKKAWGTPFREETSEVVWEYNGKYIVAFVSDNGNP